MLRTILAIAALTIALTATNAEAGNFKINFGGGNHGNHGSHNNHHHHNNHNHHQHHVHHNHYKPVYHAPVYHAPVCYYQVCYYHCDWQYKQHKVFTSLHEANAFVHNAHLHGYYASVSKTHCAHYEGPQLLVPSHSQPYHAPHHDWMP